MIIKVLQSTIHSFGHYIIEVLECEFAVLVRVSSNKNLSIINCQAYLLQNIVINIFLKFL